MKNTGVLFANDINVDRIKAIVGNFHRLGVVNAVISSCDGRKFSVVSLEICLLLLYVCVYGIKGMNIRSLLLVMKLAWFFVHFSIKLCEKCH